MRPRKKSGKTPSIVCGRRFCSQCKRWRHLVDFGVATWHDPIEREHPKYWRTECHHCERVRGRVKNARLNGRDTPYGARYPKKPLTKAERSARWWAGHKRRMQDPEYAERYREYQRIWAEGKRREAGVPRRDAMIANRKIGGIKIDPELPLGPFQDWILEKSAEYAYAMPDDGTEHSGIEHLANACHIASRSLRRFLAGYEIDKKGVRREITTIRLKIVDDCLTNEGSTELWELYPVELPVAA